VIAVQHRIGATAVEDYAVELFNVHVLELLILPDKRGSEVRASLLSFRLA
jgi:hypothetical protein